MTSAEKKSLTYRYEFTFKDGSKKELAVELDEQTLSILLPPRAAPPDWTSLGFHQCPNCPLGNAEHPRCPVAANLVDVVDAFKDFKSFEEVEVVVHSRSRTYHKRTSLQTAMSSLLGLYMVTSGCPILDKLRPMVDTHLPFMTRQETLYRIISMYLVAQHFRHKKAKAADWDLRDLRPLLEEIRTVNVAFCKRLNSIATLDASVNALVILSTLGDFPGRLITKQDLGRIERIFTKPYD